MSVGIIIRDKLRPMREHGSVLLYVHGNHKARLDGQPGTATSTLTQNYDTDRRDAFLNNNLLQVVNSTPH